MEIDLTQGAAPIVIIGLVEIAKRAGAPDRYLPILALLLGCVIALFVFAEPHWSLSWYKGLIFGILASGLWSQGKTLAGR